MNNASNVDAVVSDDQLTSLLKVETSSVRPTHVDNGEDEGRLAGTQTTIDQGLEDAKGLSPALEIQRIVAVQQHVRESGDLPTSYVIKDVIGSGIVKVSGGFADVFRGIYQGEEVCVKENRFAKNTQDEVRKKTLIEAVLCGNLSHPNIVPFLGVCFRGTTPLLVYRWMKQGDLVSYLEEYPLESRVHLFYDVALGVQYLHERSIVHGDLKSANILVSDSGRALIGDFGLASILPSSGGTVMYQAPEIFEEEGYNTKETDIYALGCLGYEIFVGNRPFANFAPQLIASKVMYGHRPERPYKSSPSWNVWGLTENIWALIEMCWEATPDRRPTIDAVIHRLEHVLPEDV
ncbi:hypothetical protein H0H92_001972 [Tricholoma furcatifolium]|nr:hypothetical protein H0H92_001972 [Tricholoma furcatifolium]